MARQFPPELHIGQKVVVHPAPGSHGIEALVTAIDAIKGTSARSRTLVLFHGFVIYDVLGLILSRAVALAQQ